MSDLVFWQNMPSHHMAGALRHLAAYWPGRVLAVYDQEILPSRIKLGWQKPSMEGVKLYFLNRIEHPDEFVRNSVLRHKSAIHVLSGLHGCRSVELARKHLFSRSFIRLALLTERPWYKGLPGVLKKCAYRFFFRTHGNRISAVLAMGILGCDFFRDLGIRPECIFPFMYQVDQISRPKVDGANYPSKDKTKFVYIGQYNERKGVDLLLGAMGRLPNDCDLEWIGCGGPLENRVKAYCRQDTRCFFRGCVPSSDVYRILPSHDVCIVPSRYDGWGMATSEAIWAGLGVIVSDQVGSKDLVESSGAGRIIPAGSVTALRDAMAYACENPSVVSIWREMAEAYAGLLNAHFVGLYLQEVLHHAFINGSTPKPIAPWLKKIGLHEY